VEVRVLIVLLGQTTDMYGPQHASKMSGVRPMSGKEKKNWPEHLDLHCVSIRDGPPLYVHPPQPGGEVYPGIAHVSNMQTRMREDFFFPGSGGLDYFYLVKYVWNIHTGLMVQQQLHDFHSTAITSAQRTRDQASMLPSKNQFLHFSRAWQHTSVFLEVAPERIFWGQERLHASTSILTRNEVQSGRRW
jgi:hypothetical protein